MKTRNIKMDNVSVEMFVCEKCNAFYGYNQNSLIKYYFICIEISKNPDGNYIVEFDISNQKTIIKFLSLNENEFLKEVHTFNSVLPITPSNINEKIKTYVLFS